MIPGIIPTIKKRSVQDENKYYSSTTKQPLVDLPPTQTELSRQNPRGQNSRQRYGKNYLIQLNFPAGSDISIFTLNLHDKIEQLRSIHLREYSITLAANADILPAVLNLSSSPPLFLSNLQYGSPTDSIPLTLGKPWVTPLGNYRFSEVYPVEYMVSEYNSGTSKSFPQQCSFTLASYQTATAGIPAHYPGNAIPTNRLIVAEPSVIILSIGTWETITEDWTQLVKSEARPYYL